MAARRDESAAGPDLPVAERPAGRDLPVVDVAQAATLTGLSKSAIRARIRRHELSSDLHDGRHRIPVVELLRGGLLVEGGRYRSLRQRAESLEEQLGNALESRDQLRQDLEKAEDKLRVVWGMARQRDQKLMRATRKRRWGIRWRFWPTGHGQ
jgi:chromosome segregation ATPase